MYGYAGPRTVVLEGNPGEGRFVAATGTDHKVTGILGWNMAKAVRQHRLHLAEGTPRSAMTTELDL
ncbi:hypothetical protein [Nonomuraea sp. NPDC049480]|uniref:hypothetical protein n=1 Tax=Nonomuraea sp. NPDC049480 TaxID=3364353 RepID=UPI0037AD6283